MLPAQPAPPVVEKKEEPVTDDDLFGYYDEEVGSLEQVANTAYSIAGYCYSCFFSPPPPVEEKKEIIPEPVIATLLKKIYPLNPSVPPI